MLKEMLMVLEMIKARALIKETIGDVKYIMVDRKFTAEHTVIVAEKDHICEVIEYKKADEITSRDKDIIYAVSVYWHYLERKQEIYYWKNCADDGSYKGLDKDYNEIVTMEQFCERLSKII